jgi:cell division protein FtsI (penicillin-binding protein 3)/stage V sporulation protein D (sporulation-specific penicillin-binding protein)
MKNLRKSPWLLLAAFVMVLLFRLYSRHVDPDPRIRSQAGSQYWARLKVAAPRGFIRDRNGIALAISSPSLSFFIDPTLWDPGNAPLLQDLIPQARLERISTKMEGRYYPIVRKVDPSVSDRIISLQLPGLFWVKETKRIYPQGNTLCHVLGFCSIDDTGLAGTELYWDSVLYAPPEGRIIAKDAKGHFVDVALPGHSLTAENNSLVQLTIDSRLQHVLEQRLREGVDRHRAEWAAAVLLEPSTGMILGMASLPDFNPNDRTTFAGKESLRNNVLSRVFEPGSTFKPIIMSNLVDNGDVSQGTIVNCQGKIKVADVTIHDIKAHGRVNAASIIADSCNVGMVSTMKNSDPFRTYSFLKRSGFGGLSGVEMPGEESGLIMPPSQWRGSVPATIAIGQGIGVTPLQLALATASVANGGKLMKPFIVCEVRDKEGKLQYKGKPVVLGEVMSSHTSQWMREAMRQAVEKGTGRSADLPGAKVAGKTGTAQVPGAGGYLKGDYTPSFVGFWPYDDPKYLLLVVIGNPREGDFLGGKVAAPIFKSIVQDIELIS